MSRKNTTAKRISALMLAILMIAGIFPTSVFAGELYGDTNSNGTVDVILTVTHGNNNIYQTETEDRLLLEELHVPYFDIGTYGLDNFYYNENCYPDVWDGSSYIDVTPGDPSTAEGVVTSMHVIIYATEKYMLGLDDDEIGDGNMDIFSYVSWDGSVGRSYMNFWNNTYNLNYYLNYNFPHTEERPDLGTTSDQQPLKDGMVLSIHLIESGDAMGTSYGLFETDNGQRDSATIKEGESLDLTFYRTTESWASGVGEMVPVVVENGKVYYMDTDSYTDYEHTSEMTFEDWTLLGITDSSGKITIPENLPAGEYYIAGSFIGDGEDGIAYDGDFYWPNEVSPGVFRLTVTESEPVPVPTAKVYFSIAHDNEFLSKADNPEDILMMKEVEIPYFDLANYGLEDYYFEREEYGPGEIPNGTPETADGNITLLHALIWITEVYYKGVPADEAGKGAMRDTIVAEEYTSGDLENYDFVINGNPGSAFILYAWGRNYNLQYYLNHEYPLASNNWGSTCDQILIEDGDIITLNHFTSEYFWTDTNALFNRIEIDGISTVAEADVGDKLTGYAINAGSSMMYDDMSTGHEPIPYAEIYMTDENGKTNIVSDWECITTTDDEGKFEIDTTDMQAGTYFIGVDSLMGMDYPDQIVSSPGVIKLILSQPPHEHLFDTVKFDEETHWKECACGDIEEGSAVAHEFKWVTDKEATCKEAGSKHEECDCGAVRNEGTEIAKLDHEPEVIKGKEATCTETGLTEGKKCSVCGETLKEQEVIEAVAHEETTTKQAVEATCEKEGYTGDTVCEVCEEVIKKGEVIAAKNHSFGKWNVVKEATCTEKGSEKRACDCGKEETREIPMKAHSPQIIPSVEATCESTGLTEGEKCKDCGEILVMQEEVAKKAHTPKVVGAIEATCEKAGYTGDTVCEICGHKIATGNVVEKLAHKEVIIPAVEATGTETGLTEGVKCAVCGTVLKEQEVIAMLVQGDADGNGEIEAKDATQILRFINGKPSAFDENTEALEKLADVNGDGILDAKDATQILRFINGKPSLLDK